MKKGLVLFFICIWSTVCWGQELEHGSSSSLERRNSIYVQNFIIFPTVCYDRMVPLNRRMGIIPKIGVTYYDGLVPLFEASLYMGSDRHFGELGAGYWAFEGTVINANYRYMGRRGLLIKGGFSYIPGEEGFPLLGIGYSF